MDLKAFTQHRMLNLKNTIFDMEERNQGEKMTNVALGKDSLVRNKSVSISDIIDQNDKSWDLEYYVHYLVKWKGMQVS